MNQLTDYIKTYSDQVGADFCDTIIERFNNSKSTYVDKEGLPTFHDLNITQKYFDRDPVWIQIQEILQNILTRVVDKYVNDIDCRHDFPQRWTYEQFRMKMYEPNGRDQFKTHVDVGDHSSAIRFLVAFIYLNDVDEGGETSFPKLDYLVPPKRGQILVFPPTWQYRHAGLPPISSNKYIIGSYLHYNTQGVTQILP
tara:strand:- start:44 stop:634 length:591 start_codon:yes stop_codon:yes gene_type:complete